MTRRTSLLVFLLAILVAIAIAWYFHHVPATKKDSGPGAIIAAVLLN